MNSRYLYLMYCKGHLPQELSAEETWKEWDTLLRELLEVCDVAKIGTYRELKARMEAFSERDAGAIVRSAWAIVATGKTPTLPSHLGRAPAPWLPSLAMVCAELGLPPPDAAQGPGPSARFFAQQVEIGVRFHRYASGRWELCVRVPSGAIPFDVNRVGFWS